MPTIDARQDTLAAPALVMISALRRVIEASGVDVDAERILTLTLYVATAQTAKHLRSNRRKKVV
jgi:hypothetical protein